MKGFENHLSKMKGFENPCCPFSRVHFRILHYITPETPANKGKTAHMSGFHVGASNRNRTL